MESNEPTIQCQTLGLQHTDRDLNARLLQFPNAPTRHFGKRGIPFSTIKSAQGGVFP